MAITGSLLLTPAASSTQLVATATLSDSTTQDVSSQATWSSSNTLAATVSSTGLVVAVSNGTSIVSAAYGGQTASTTVSVVNLNTCPFGVTNHGSVTASINGVPFKAGCVTVASLSGGTLHLTAADNLSLVGQVLDLQVAGADVGTVAADGSAFSRLTAFLQGGGGSGPVWSIAPGGSLTINALSPSGASGTFTFTLIPTSELAIGSKTIVNGTFDVTF
jgi:hypothetical protein